MSETLLIPASNKVITTDMFSIGDKIGPFIMLFELYKIIKLSKFNFSSSCKDGFFKISSAFL